MMPQPASNNSLGYERIGRFIYAFQRTCIPMEELRSDHLINVAPPELVQRAARLAQKFQHIVNNAASTPEIELESTLREAAELGCEINRFLETR
jgi:hypothetical protein